MRKITEQKIKDVFSEMGKRSGMKRKAKYLSPESPDYDPDYFKKIRRGVKVSISSIKS